MAGHSADSRVQTLQKQNDALKAEIDQRRREISVAQSDSWLMQEARRLGYVLNGETVYVPVPAGKSVPSSGGIDPGPAPTFQPPGATPSPAATAAPVNPLQTSSAPTPYSYSVPTPTPH